MNDTDFIKAMQQGLPPITAPTAPGLSVTEYRMDGARTTTFDDPRY